MKVHRFYLNISLVPGSVIVADSAFFNQARNVLKLERGEAITVFDNSGKEAPAVIKDYTNDAVVLELGKAVKNKAEPKREAVLYLAVLKNEHFEFAVQKAVECGVSEIVPLITARTVKLNIRPDRIERIIKEAAEQSGRGVVPKLKPLMTFAEAIKIAGKNNVLFDKEGGTLSRAKLGDVVGVWIGPEGGFTEEEIGAADAAGFILATLGSRTLRGETAAAIATYLVAQ